MLFEALKLLGFFGTYFVTKNLYFATYICIAISWSQICYYKITKKNISYSIWISVILITVCGGLGAVFHNATFIMIKPTILYWIFGVGLLLTAKNNIIKKLSGKTLHLDDEIWKRLNTAWAVFFFFIGTANLVVVNYCSEDAWVKFKLFGSMSCLIVFIIISCIIIYPHIRESKS